MVPTIVRTHPGLTGLFFAYFLPLLALGFATGNDQAPFYAVFIAIGALIVVRLHTRFGLSRLVLWCLASWGMAHMVGGLVEVGGDVIYEHSLGAGELRFDKVVHFFGFGSATVAAYEVLRHSVAAEARPRAVAVAALFVGLGVGAINETIEFVITLLPGESNVGGFSNTGWDLVANAAGAAVAASLAPFVERKGTAEMPSAAGSGERATL